MQTDYASLAVENIGRFGTDIDKYGPGLLANRYTDRTHFIYELIQNAEDAIGWRLRNESAVQRGVKFYLCPTGLTFRHSGLPFAEEHVRGICNIGKGTKQQDLTAIGKHGIGFKSVYAYTHHPEIHSGEEHFIIDSFVRPRKTAERDSSDFDTSIFIPFDHPEIAPEIAYKEILNRLNSLGLETLLFLRHITSIEWSCESGEQGTYVRESSQTKGGLERIELLGENRIEEEEESWFVFRKAVFQGSDPAGFVEVAFSVETVERDSIEVEQIARVKDSPLVVFFPTEKETHLGFLIQGPYRTTPSRDNIPKDDPWNQSLVKQTAELVIDSVVKLREAGFLTVSTLEALVVDPSKYEPTSQTALFQPIASSIVTAFKTLPIIPRIGSGHVTGREARLAGSESLRQLFSSEQLTAILNSPSELQWITGEITRVRSAGLREFLSKSVGVEEIDAESSIRKFSNPFLEVQPDEWVRRMYHFLLEQPALQRKPWFWELPIVRLENGTHVPVKNANGVLNAWLPSADATEFPTVRKAVCNDDGSSKLLVDLGLRQPELVDDVIRNILPRYGLSTAVSSIQYDTDMMRIIEAYKTDSKQRRQDLVEELNRATWIACRNAGSGCLDMRVPQSTLYFETEKLEALFEGNREIWFVDNDKDCLRNTECRGVLEACGVASVLQRSKSLVGISAEYLADVRRKAGIQDLTRHEIVDHSIYGIEAVATYIASARPDWARRSLQLWVCLHDAIRKHGESFLYGSYTWHYYHQHPQRPFPAQFVRLLQESQWLPGSGDGPVKPSDICFADLPEEYQTDSNAAFVKILGFKPDAIRLLAETADIDPEVVRLLSGRRVTVEDALKMLGDKSGFRPDAVSTFKTDEPSDTASIDQSNGTGSPSGHLQPTGACRLSDRSSGTEGSAGPESCPVSSQPLTGINPASKTTSNTNSVERNDRSSSTPTTPSTRTEHQSQESLASGQKVTSPGHTADPREWHIKHLERQLKELRSTGVLPKTEQTDDEPESNKTPPSDERFRDAVVAYEQQHGRIPVVKPAFEAGHDIDSYVPIPDSDERMLSRRIEVKGKGLPWTGGQIVELSNRQFVDAYNHETGASVVLGPDFDYWLYVVEDDGLGNLNVLAIRNPARAAAHFEFRGGTWRDLAENH